MNSELHDAAASFLLTLRFKGILVSRVIYILYLFHSHYGSSVNLVSQWDVDFGHDRREKEE